ncbi:GPO family capsid scaffolding protein [Chromobacterium sphagni]|uniref:Phage capsid protein n=1 Tax=Chromobacterium sphagni TaxID=1903179 RepID=A0ABX3CC65_9NEIS|nr:GPO family capsid scaffolding protein [Chromobacterium sphagni]OHX19711.1 hypothetical protein BI344_08730 [Chromobacterium sphagni]OHX19829.1 hypothetical protein BI344_16405 [Chromobacterium sphagni]
MARAKKFRVATEGATTDGRNIERSWLEQIAANYNPATYGARVNMEHIKAYTADSPFKRYGDVLEVSTEEVDGKLALFAVIDPTDELVAMNKARQKVYCSIEVNPNFADSGEAYLVGLAVTDDPASLGCEMLQFCAHAKASPLARYKQQPANLFTEAMEFTLELEEENKPSLNLFARVKELLAGKGKTDAAQFADIGQAVETVAASQRDLLDKFATLGHQQGELQSFKTQLATLSADHAALVQKLSQQPSTQPRTTATGGNAEVVTDC